MFLGRSQGLDRKGQQEVEDEERSERSRTDEMLDVALADRFTWRTVLERMELLQPNVDLRSPLAAVFVCRRTLGDV